MNLLHTWSINIKAKTYKEDDESWREVYLKWNLKKNIENLFWKKILILQMNQDLLK